MLRNLGDNGFFPFVCTGESEANANQVELQLHATALDIKEALFREQAQEENLRAGAPCSFSMSTQIVSVVYFQEATINFDAVDLLSSELLKNQGNGRLVQDQRNLVNAQSSTVCISRFFVDEDAEQETLLIECNLAKIDALAAENDEASVHELKLNLLSALLVLSHHTILVISGDE